MKRILKLGGYMLTGFVIGSLLCILLSLMTLMIIRPIFGGGSPESYLPILPLIIMPICFLIGSFVTGYLSQPLITRKLTYLLLTPTLYLFLFYLIDLLMSTDSMEGFLSFIPLYGIAWVWTLFSLGGVYWGAYIRSKRRRDYQKKR